MGIIDKSDLPFVGGAIIMRGSLSGTRAVLSGVLVVCLLAAAVPALGAIPAITGLDSSTHIVDDFHFSDDSPSFEWDAASDLPRKIAAYEAMVDAKDVTVAGDVAFVADYSAGLRLVDISEPGTPMLLGTYDTSGYAYGVAVAGDVAYVADHHAGLRAVDVSEPGTPTLLGTYNTPGYALDVEVEGDVAYVADDTQGLRVLDVSEPGTPTLLGTYDTPDYAWGVDVAGDVAYVADNASGLQVFDISDPTSPTPIGTCDTPGSARDVEVRGDVAYVADEWEGLQTIDISDPTSPTPLGSLDTPDEAFGIDVSGDLVYLADKASGIHVIDVSEPGSLVLLGTYDTPGYAYGVCTSGNVAYVADSASGLQVIDVSDSAPLTLLSSFDTPGYPYDVAIAGDTACVAAMSAGLRIIDVSEPGTPTSLGHYPSTSGSSWAVAVDGDTAYVADGTAGLQIIDVSEPGTPTLLGTCDKVSDAHGVAVAGDTVYVGDWKSGLRVVDVSEPGTPTLLGTYDTPSNAWGVAVAGDTAYVADNSSGLQILDVSEPGTPTLLGTYDTPHYAYDVAVAGDAAYVVDGGSGLHAIDVSRPDIPSLIDSYDTSGEALAVAVAGDMVYVADGNPGLHVFDVGDGPVGYSYTLDQTVSTTPNAVADSIETSAAMDSVADGTWWFHVRAVGLRGEAGEAAHRRVMIDTTPPVTTSDAVAQYIDSATINLSANDGVGTSQVGFSYYKLNGASTWTMGDTVVATGYGEHTLQFFSDDNAGNNETPKSVQFVVKSDSTDYTPISGSNRYSTAIKTSQATFTDGTADCVVIATGTNWPDALGGAALAAAKNGPILLTTPGALSSGIITEIRRLGADEAVILGGTGAVSDAVEDALDTELGADNVTRVWGTNRYKTAEAIAAATVAELGASYDGTAFVGTGANFPDALAASPIAAAKGWPIFLADPRGNPPAAGMSGLGVTDVLICGGTGVVSDTQEDALDAEFGAARVDRLGGSDRYSTAVVVASHGVDSAGLAWDGLALSTGENFPDALAGGVLAGKSGSVMLLTASDSLPNPVRAKLTAERDWIADVYYLGGTGAISQAVRDDVIDILH